MGRSQFVGGLGLSPERVNPGMKFHATLVALFYHPLKRVPCHCRRRALFAGKESAPRLDIGTIEGIAFGTHLKNNGIDATRL